MNTQCQLLVRWRQLLIRWKKSKWSKQTKKKVPSQVFFLLVPLCTIAQLFTKISHFTIPLIVRRIKYRFSFVNPIVINLSMKEGTQKVVFITLNFTSLAIPNSCLTRKMAILLIPISSLPHLTISTIEINWRDILLNVQLN